MPGLSKTSRKNTLQTNAPAQSKNPIADLGVLTAAAFLRYHANMMIRCSTLAISTLLLATVAHAEVPAGNAENGREVFEKCAGGVVKCVEILGGVISG